MTLDIWILFTILGLTLVLFTIDVLRYDVVAMIALLAVTLTGLIPFEHAFSGFSNPAVITVAAVLVLTRGLENSGFVEAVGEKMIKIKGGIYVQLAMLTGFVALLSTFMNNIGSVALMLPLTLYIAQKKELPASILLMPLAFAAHFGGMITLIGTPTNLIVSDFRNQAVGIPFKMFDFAPVGLGIAMASILFIVLIGWRLIPHREGQTSAIELFNIEEYVTEVRLPQDSTLVGISLRELGDYVDGEMIVLSLVRNGERRITPSPDTRFKVGDILTIQTDTKSLESFVSKTNGDLVGSENIEREDLITENMALFEAVVTANSRMVNRSAFDLDLRRRFGVNLIAISRQGTRLRARLDRIKFKVGDVLLLQADPNIINQKLSQLGCLPLAERELSIGKSKNIVASILVFLGAIILAATGLVTVAVSFVLGAVVMLLIGLVSLRDVYESINWPILILLGAMIPVGEALEITGGSNLIANLLLTHGELLSPAVLLAVVMIATMFLSDLVNNTAAVILMAPIAISLAQGLGGSIDTMLIAVVIASSCAFLTPIGHQSNTLVMGPGGYKFGDYWRLGLLIELVVVGVGVPLILLFWPFGI